ncbi:unnamed protein product [Urochloa humidicola]
MVFKINPEHPVFKDLNTVWKSEPDSTKTKPVVEFLYEAALISNGYIPESPAELYEKIYLILEIVLTNKWGRSDTKKAETIAGEAVTETGSSYAMVTEVIEASEVKHGIDAMVTKVIEPSEVKSEIDAMVTEVTEPSEVKPESNPMEGLVRSLLGVLRLKVHN